ADCQPYGNEWIDFSKTYYKFKVGNNGVFKITKTDLDAAGVPTSANASHFKIFRNGAEVDVYRSTTGPMGSNDFLLLPGDANDGYLDSVIYNGQVNQTNPFMSLFSDTATYFLMVDDVASTHIFQDATVYIPGNPGAAADWIWAQSIIDYRNVFWQGEIVPTYTDALYDAPQFSR